MVDISSTHGVVVWNEESMVVEEFIGLLSFLTTHARAGFLVFPARAGFF
jgi:hypothetical protein